HPQGPGKTQQRKCKVRFDLYIPVKWNRFPFLLLVCRGSHNHHPPYPTRLARDVADEVVAAIKRQECHDLTARRFILSPEFAGLNRKYGENTLRALHQSLKVEDRVSALIRKQKILQYPEGSSLAGVIRECFDQLRSCDEHWIRKIHSFDDEHLLIICFTYGQAKAFTKECLEMDLAFKMVQGKTNVFSISGWNNDTKRINVYCYAFLNTETHNVYSKMFELIFEVLGNVSRRPIKFVHIGNGDEGIRVVTMDMCKKQAPVGLGDYLHLQDPSWEWQEHLQHVLMFYKTHVQQNFAKEFPTHPMRHRILQLWDMPTKNQLLEQMQSICSVYPELSSWLNSKKKTWILSGLTPEESKIPVKWWTYARDHTGISESSHFQDNNFTGRKISLLGAVLKYDTYLVNDRDVLTVDTLKLHAQEMFDVEQTYRKTQIDIGARLMSNVKRHGGTAADKTLIILPTVYRLLNRFLTVKGGIWNLNKVRFVWINLDNYNYHDINHALPFRYPNRSSPFPH
ncbi:hypothetical protein V8E54_013796, partial [Elaphomyces granulatus]